MKLSRLFHKAINYPGELIQRTKRKLLGGKFKHELRKVHVLPQIYINAGQKQEFKPVTLRTPENISAKTNANEQLLYFTSPSCSKDDARLFFISDRTGHDNIFMRDLTSGESVQLSQNTSGVMKSYIYFGGTPYRGIGKASPCLHAASDTVYYIQNHQVCKARSGEPVTILAELPPGQMTGYTHVSSDGKRLCIPTVDARALGGDDQLRGRPRYSIDDRVQRENLSSYLRVYDTNNGNELLCERVPKAWITHVQFSPLNSELILYNHEWASQSGIRRLWLWDGSRHIPLRNAKERRHADDWACHEVWARDGSAVLYHGKYRRGVDFVGRVDTVNHSITELALPRGWNQYGHYNWINHTTLFSDGHYRAPIFWDAFSCSWLSRIDVDWGKGEMRWTPLTAHHTSWHTQDTHPHPSGDHQGKFIYFNSDQSGRRAIYRVPIDIE